MDETQPETQLVRQVTVMLGQRARAVALGADPVPAVRGRAVRRRRRRVVLAAAGTVVLLAGVVPALRWAGAPWTATESVRPAADPARDSALRRALEARPAELGMEATPGWPISRIYCGLDVRGASPDGSRVYAWANCLTFEPGAGGLVIRSGVGSPVLLAVSGRGPATRLDEVTMASDGAQYARSIRAMFPQDVAEYFLAQEITTVPDEAALRAEAAADLAAARSFGP